MRYIYICPWDIYHSTNCHLKSCGVSISQVNCCRILEELNVHAIYLLLQTSLVLARASPGKVDQGEFDYELEDTGNGLFSGSRRFLPTSEFGGEEKRNPERP